MIVKRKQRKKINGPWLKLQEPKMRCKGSLLVSPHPSPQKGWFPIHGWFFQEWKYSAGFLCSESSCTECLRCLTYLHASSCLKLQKPCVSIIANLQGITWGVKGLHNLSKTTQLVSQRGFEPTLCLLCWAAPASDSCWNIPLSFLSLQHLPKTYLLP